MQSVQALPPRRLRDVLELSTGYGLILLVLWTPRTWQLWTPRTWQRILYAIAAGFLLTALWRSFTSGSALGLRTANLLRSLWIAGAALLVAAAAVLLSMHQQTLHAPATPLAFLERYWVYALWSFFQQILLQDFSSCDFSVFCPGGLRSPPYVPRPSSLSHTSRVPS